MNIRSLPAGSSPKPVSYPYFPTRWQHFLWRNWGLVPPEALAEVLGAAENDIRQAASELGLSPDPEVSDKWLTKSYQTLIRANWHLLNYPQLLQLLKWTPEKMAFTLKEEDFLFIKLGMEKPDCPVLRMTPLTPEEKRRTGEIKTLLERYFPEHPGRYEEPPFAFADAFAPRGSAPERGDFEFNLIHAYAAGCGDVLGEADVSDPAPENLLAQYASLGINGIWMHALLHLLSPIPGAEEFSPGCEKRIANLRNIVARCGRYGIKVYLYLNEPRCMPMDFYAAKPLWAGRPVPERNTMTVCTTRSPEPLAWLENAVKTVFTLVPGLGGLLTITMSENPTNCHYDLHHEECPSCAGVPPEKIVADVNCAVERGMHAAAPDARLLIYDWGWARSAENRDPVAFKKAVLDLLPVNPGVFLCSVSEWGMITRVGGVEEYLVDYSISQPGPGEEAREVWRHARSRGIPVAAKVQINNSWELPSVPCIPAPYLIREHLENLKKEQVRGLMLSWTLGGFPGGNLKLLSASPEEIARADFGEEAAEKICEAWKLFSRAFREFPFHVDVIYFSPVNLGPANPLYLTPAGYRSGMVGIPYDDLDKWRGVYPEEVFAEQFRIMSETWRQGLEVLAGACRIAPASAEAACRDLTDTAEAAYCHLRSVSLQIAFIRAREHGFDRRIMAECAREELELALRLYRIVRRDSRIGFEASNHYYYTLNDLMEKVVNCDFILRELGVPPER